MFTISSKIKNIFTTNGMSSGTLWHKKMLFIVILHTNRNAPYLVNISAFDKQQQSIAETSMTTAISQSGE